MKPADVSLDGVWKRYRLRSRRDAATFWALRDVSLGVPRGTSFGVIGRNGAGKSTLFKLLAGITAPTQGRIVIHGRVSALMEIGSGFHPELTGRENVFLSGAILGMRRKEIAAKLPRMVEFAGVERFIDTPVKWYSSGMYVRLGFSIAAHLEPDVLLVDEVLAVGDAEFQVKCLERIRELKREGVTILFISHDLTTVEQLCDAAVLLERGEVTATGRPAEVVAEYHRSLTKMDSVAREGAPANTVDGSLRITNLTFMDPRGGRPIAFRTGDPVTVTLRYSAARRLCHAIFELSYYSSDGKTLFATATTARRPAEVGPPGGVVEFTCPALSLQPGAYYVGAIARDALTGQVIHWWDGGTTLYVEGGAAAPGQFYMPHSWRVINADQEQVGAER